MAFSTTTAVWRSGGGDTTKNAYAGSMAMYANFYLNPIAAVNTAITRSVTDLRTVVLPIGAVITEVQVNAAATGGASPTFDMGFTTYGTGTVNPQTLINEGVANAGKSVFNWTTGTSAASFGAVMSAVEMVTITGHVGASAATGGAVTGRITYYVPTDGAYVQ